MSGLFSPAIFGRARNIEDATESEACMQIDLQALMINARTQRDNARRDGDVAREAGWQRNVDWLLSVLPDYERRVYQTRVTGEKMLVVPSTAGGRSMDDQLHDEATVLAAGQHRAEAAASAVHADADETHRLDAMEARIHKLERDDRAERLALQALAGAGAS